MNEFVQRERKKQIVCSFFGRIYGVPVCLCFYPTFRAMMLKVLPFSRHWYVSCSLHQQKRNVSMSQKKGSTYNPKALLKRKFIKIGQCEKGLWVLQQKSHDFLPTFSSFFLVEHFSLEAKRTSSTSMKYVKSILKILWTLNDLRSVLICSLLYHA